MTFFDRTNQYNRLHNLISRSATGTPEELAEKFEVSERTMYNMILVLKEFGAEVKYSSSERSFVYTTPISLNFDPARK